MYEARVQHAVISLICLMIKSHSKPYRKTNASPQHATRWNEIIIIFSLVSQVSCASLIKRHCAYTKGAETTQ